MKTRIFFLLLLTSFCANEILAQDLDSPVANETDTTAWENWNLKTGPRIIKFSPFDIFSFMPTFGADIEIRTGKSESLQFGAGLIPNAFQLISRNGLNDFDKINGYRLRAEGRLYMPRVQNNYFSAGISFRHLIISNEVAIGMEGFEGEWGQQQFAYFVNTPMRFHRFNTSLDLKLGTQSVLENGFALDVYLGLSIRSINVISNSEIPVGGVIPDDRRGMWELSDGHSLMYPIPVLGIKLGFGSDGR